MSICEHRLVWALSALALFGCETGPGTPDAATLDASIGVDGQAPDDAGGEATSCGVCDDGVDCTLDECVEGACVHTPDATRCADGDFCNGEESCDPSLGCLFAARGPCNDEDTCTLDVCDPEAEACVHLPRDLDGDGDVDARCGGGDCADADAHRSSMANEVCGDLSDNDCDGDVDEPECGRAPHDVCADALEVSAGGAFVLNTAGAMPDYPLGCRRATRDLVARLTLTERRGLTVEARATSGTTALGLRTDCAERASELACRAGFPAVIRRRALEPGTYWIIVAAGASGDVDLDVTLGPPLDPLTNETCATPLDVSAGGAFHGSTVEANDDLTTSCGLREMPDLTYTFTTTRTQDVAIGARALGREVMAFSVRTDCANGSTELRCGRGAFGLPVSAILHQLPAGTYFIVVEGPSSIDVEFTLDVAFLPPTPPLAGDRCDDPLTLTPDGSVVSGTLAGMEDDLMTGCGSGRADVVYEFTLAAASDVTVQLAEGVYANVSMRATCDLGFGELACTTGNPARERLRNVPAGTYYLIVESSTLGPFTISVDATSPPTVPVDVTGNDTCDRAHPIPAGGGLFRGSTRFLTNTLSGVSCGAGAGAPDAAFELTITSRSRVVAATDGSAFDTVLHLHRAMCIGGAELVCDDDGGTGNLSLIDTMLDPGTYFIVVDGFGASTAGDYLLEVSVTP